MLLAVARMPADGDALARAAAATGMVAADVSRRLTGTLPRMLLSDADADRVTAAAAALEEAGFLVVTCDPALVPGDDERLVARRVVLEPGALVAFDAQGAAHACPPAAMSLIQRGVRVATRTEKTVTTTRKLALGRAVLTGGLAWTRKQEQVATRTTERREAFALVHRQDGEPDIVLDETRLDYRFLGTELEPSSRANLDRVVARLRALAPSVPCDERVGRPGFVSGLPSTSADPVDLGLALVLLAHLRERAG